MTLPITTYTHFTAWNGPQKCLITGIALQALGLLVAGGLLVGFQLSGIGASMTLCLGFLSSIVAWTLATTQRSQRNRLESDKNESKAFQSALPAPQGTYGYLNSGHVHFVQVEQEGRLVVHAANLWEDLTPFTEGKTSLPEKFLTSMAQFQKNLPKENYFSHQGPDGAWYLVSRGHFERYPLEAEVESRAKELRLTKIEEAFVNEIASVRKLLPENHFLSFSLGQGFYLLTRDQCQRFSSQEQLADHASDLQQWTFPDHTVETFGQNALFQGNSERAFAFLSDAACDVFLFKAKDSLSRTVFSKIGGTLVELYSEGEKSPYNLVKIAALIDALQPREYLNFWSEKAGEAVLLSRDAEGKVHTDYYGPLNGQGTYTETHQARLKSLEEQKILPAPFTYSFTNGDVTEEIRQQVGAKVREHWPLALGEVKQLEGMVVERDRVGNIAVAIN